MTTTDPSTQDQSTSDATVPQQDVTLSTHHVGPTQHGRHSTHTVMWVVRMIDRLGLPLTLILFGLVRWILPLILVGVLFAH